MLESVVVVRSQARWQDRKSYLGITVSRFHLALKPSHSTKVGCVFNHEINIQLSNIRSAM